MSASVCMLPVEAGEHSWLPVLDFILLKTKVLLFTSVTPRVDGLRMLRAFYSSHLNREVLGLQMCAIVYGFPWTQTHIVRLPQEAL